MDIAFEYGDFPTRKAAAVWLNRQDEENGGPLPCVGLMKDAQGRKVLKVYCSGWKPKDDNLRHEIIGTHIRVQYPQFRFIRGYQITDCLCDMFMTDGENSYEWEIDCGTMKQKQVKWRWKRHKCSNDILIATAPRIGSPEDRMERLLAWSDELGDRAFVTTLDRIKTQGPHARIWATQQSGQGLMMIPEAVSSVYQNHKDATPESVTGQQEDNVATAGS